MIERVQWGRLARAHRQLGGQLFNPTPQGAFAANGNDPLYVSGSNTSFNFNQRNPVCAGNLQRYPASGLPAWCNGVTQVGGAGSNGTISFKVALALIRFEIQIELVTIGGGATFNSVNVNATTTGAGAGGTVFANEPVTAPQGAVGQLAVSIWTFMFLYQVNSTASDTVQWDYQMNGSAGLGGSAYSQLKAYRVA